MDGGPLGGLEYESFNAAGAKLTFNGTNTHPGTAKNKMRNATKLAMEFNSYLPVEEAPEYTEGMKDSIIYFLNGDVEQSKAYIYS